MSKPTHTPPENPEHNDQGELEYDGPSKSQIKREMQALQELGIKLTQLTAEQLTKIPLTEELHTAIIEANKITQKSGKKRHLKFIGKLMRKCDGEAIETAYQKLMDTQHQLTRQHHIIEQWRDQLLTGDNSQLHAFINAYPNADSQHIRQLIRSAQKENQQSLAPANARKLFRLLRDTLDHHSKQNNED